MTSRLISTISIVVTAWSPLVIGRDTLAEAISKTPTAYHIDGMVYRDVAAANIAVPIENALVYLQPVVETVPLASLAQARVRIDSTRTDSKGAFSFRNVMAGAYTLIVSADRYRTRTLDVTLTRDESFFLMLVDEKNFSRVVGTVEAVSCLPLIGSGRFPCALRVLPSCTVWAALPIDRLESANETHTAPLPLAAYRAVTGADGTYCIDSIPLRYSGQRVVVWTRFEGMDPISVDTVVINGEATEVNFALSPSIDVPITIDGLPDEEGRNTLKKEAVSYSERSRRLSLCLQRSQVVSIEAFVLSGRREERLWTKRFFRAGTYRFNLDNQKFGTGVVIVRVEGEDFAQTIRIVLSQKK